MKPVIFLASFIVVLFACAQAEAVKSQVDLTPANLKQAGFSVVSASRDGSTMDVTVRRELSKAHIFDAATHLELVRTATLEVSGPAGVIVRCNLEPELGEGAAVYHFQIARANLPQSRLTVSEIDDYKKSERREHLIGGGTFFTFHLADVVK